MRIDAEQKQETMSIHMQHEVPTPDSRGRHNQKTMEHTREDVRQRESLREQLSLQDNADDPETRPAKPTDIPTEAHEGKVQLQLLQSDARDETVSIHIHNYDDDTKIRADNCAYSQHGLHISAVTEGIENTEHEAGSPVSRRLLRERTRVHNYKHSPVRMTGKRLRRLRNVKIEDCRLAIGPSQQYGLCAVQVCSPLVL